MAQQIEDGFVGTLVEFEASNLYNYVFSHLTHMIENIKDKQMRIYYCEANGDIDGIWRLWNVPSTTEKFDNPNLVPKQLLLHWVPNKYDAGNIFRVLIAKIVTYQAARFGSSKQQTPSAPPPNTPEKDKVTPGTG